MMRALMTAILAAALLTVAPAAGAATKPQTSWDGLVQVKSKRLSAAYLLPGADFRPYTKVMMDQTEVDFRKNWLRDYNSSAGLSARMSDADAQKILDQVRTGFEKIFIKAYQDAGYQVVAAPGPDVMRLRTGVINLAITAPDRMTPGRSYTFSRDAGEATLVLEARDSVTGALLGRGLDRRAVGDTGPYLRTSVSNRGDFSNVFHTWAKASVDALTELKARSRSK